MNLGFSIKRGDLRRPLKVTLKDNGVPIDLSVGVTRVDFCMRKKGTTTGGIRKPAVVTDAVKGKVQYNWEAGDTAVVGVYYAEFEIVATDLKPDTFPGGDEYIVVKIVADMG